MIDEILVYDIETYVPNVRPDPARDELRLFGCFSYITNKHYILTKIEDIQKIINNHKFLVGFNSIEYDNAILLRSGINLQYKIMIDLKRIFENRAQIMKIEEGMLGDLLMHYSLDFISKTIKVVNEDTSKMEIDKKLFVKKDWAEEETKLMCTYLKRDIEVTKKVYEWLENYFASFKEFLPSEDVRKKKYLTDSPAVYTYKVICKELGVEPEFNEKTEGLTYGGGYVAYPAGEEFKGNIAYLDFTSLYPSLFIQNNLFSNNCKCCKLDEKWHGDKFFNVTGFYCKKQQGKIENLLKRMFLLRKQYKKEKNPKEYSLKIILNTSYGLAGNSSFKHLYNRDTASDCTALGRQCIKYVRKKFRELGYINLMSDTDSVAVLIPEDKTLQQTLDVAKEVCRELQSHMPFPWEEFGLKLEEQIKYAFFFKGDIEKDENLSDLDEDDLKNKSKMLLKKNYIMVTNENKLIIKNLGIRKKSNSLLSRKIFFEYLVPQIIEKGQIKFSKLFIQDIILKLLEEDYTLIAMRKDVGRYNEYVKSKTSLPAQISLKYGAGTHMLIPNTKGIGVGKGKFYCTINEYEENELKIKDIDLSNVLQELEYFTKEQQNVGIYGFGG
jgi:DNA polymerase elongation subunit (family B)